jgi:hypothetical protein
MSERIDFYYLGGGMDRLFHNSEVPPIMDADGVGNLAINCHQPPDGS